MSGASPAVPNGGAAAWLRVAAYFTVCLGTLGLAYAFGPLYVELLKEPAFGGNPSATAFVGSLCSGLMDMLAVFSGLVIERYGARRTCMIGAVLASSGFALGAAATQLWHLYLTVGILGGTWISLSLMAPIVLMNRWFDTRLSRSHALGNMGAAVVPLALGNAAPALFASLGWRTALLIVAGADLVVLLLASLVLTPPPMVATRKSDPDPGTSAASAAPVGASDASDASSADALAPCSDVGIPGPFRQALPGPFRQALAQRSVQLVCCYALLYGLGAWVPVVHIVRLGSERGLNDNDASRLLTYLALGSLTMRLPVATLADVRARPPSPRRTRTHACMHVPFPSPTSSTRHFTPVQPFAIPSAPLLLLYLAIPLGSDHPTIPLARATPPPPASLIVCTHPLGAVPSVHAAVWPSAHLVQPPAGLQRPVRRDERCWAYDLERRLPLHLRLCVRRPHGVDEQRPRLAPVGARPPRRTVARRDHAGDDTPRGRHAARARHRRSARR